MAEAEENKLYIVHVGFYDRETNFGVYESHTNFFVVAANPRDAKMTVKNMPIYREKNMHTDGIQEILSVQGYRVRLEKTAVDGQNLIRSIGHDELNTQLRSTGT